MKIGVIIAMDVEFRQMVDLLGGKTEGRVGSNDVVLWQCGIGKVNAAIGTMRLVEQHHPDCILSTGLAGGIDQSMRVMDVLVASETMYHDVWCGEGNVLGQVQGLPARFPANGSMLDFARRLSSSGQSERVVEGLLCTGDRFITDRSEQSAIKHNFPQALAVDMESTAIAHTCHCLNVPFLTIRVISDTPGHTDDHQQQWNDFLASMCDRSFRWVSDYLNILPEHF